MSAPVPAWHLPSPGSWQLPPRCCCPGPQPDTSGGGPLTGASGASRLSPMLRVAGALGTERLQAPSRMWVAAAFLMLLVPRPEQGATRNCPGVSPQASAGHDAATPCACCRGEFLSSLSVQGASQAPHFRPLAPGLLPRSRLPALPCSRVQCTVIPSCSSRNVVSIGGAPPALSDQSSY